LEVEIDRRSNIIVDAEAMLSCYCHLCCIPNWRGSTRIVVVGFKTESPCIASVKKIKRPKKREVARDKKHRKIERKLERMGMKSER
jgi:hypothetical protein